MSKDKWIIHLQELQRKAQLIARAAKWAVQRQYPHDPVFAGPIVAADVVASALTTADVRFRSMVQFVSSTDEGSKKLSPFSWGSTLQVFVDWARTVRMVSTPPLQKPSGKAGADAASVSSKSSRLSNRSKSSSGTKTSTKSAWYYAVARGKVQGVFTSWAEAQPLVSGFSNAIHKKFRSVEKAGEFVK